MKRIKTDIVENESPHVDRRMAIPIWDPWDISFKLSHMQPQWRKYCLIGSHLKFFRAGHEKLIISESRSQHLFKLRILLLLQHLSLMLPEFVEILCGIVDPIPIQGIHPA